MVKIVHNGLVDPQLLFITDEAYFHISSYISSQDTWIWSNGYSLSAPDFVTWHKIGVWCVVNAMWIIGPVFHQKPWTWTSKLGIYWKYFLNSWLMMGSLATFNKTVILCILHKIHSEVFDYRIISTGLWSPRLLNIGDRDLCLWGNLKGKMYRTHLTLLKLSR